MGLKHQHPTGVDLIEVGPRDGLQNEPSCLSVDEKVAFIRRLADCGLKRIEVASFVNPRRVPQMAGAEEVVTRLGPMEGVTRIGLVLNVRGARRAIACGIDELGAVATASDAFGLRNQGRTSAETVADVAGIAEAARAAGTPVQAAIAMAFGCPLQGPTAVARVVDMAKRLGDLPIVELVLADTVGLAVPAQVSDLFGAVAEATPHLPLRAHFHDTRGMGAANVWAAIQAGVRSIDASVSGLGGCPFAPGASGNVATEDVVWMLDRSGHPTGVALADLLEVSRGISRRLRRTAASALSRIAAAEPGPTFPC